MNLPDIKLIQSAASLLAGHAVITPLLESPLFNAEVGGRVLLKAEPLQRTGSFKFRGAYTKLSRLSAEQRSRGVVAYSSGNHAQGVAHAAGLYGVPATIVMPDTAPRLKINNTRAYGAKVVTYEIGKQSREAIGEAISNETGAVLVRPYDDPDIISGQGTVGLEIADQLSNLNIIPDQVLCPCGGGGLISGLAMALHNNFPDTPVWAVEPDYFDDTARSLDSGEREQIIAGHSSICDAIITPTPGELTFEINRQHLAGGFAVNDSAVLRAMAVAFNRFKLVVEPGGCVALAAIMEDRVELAGKTTIVICSGGNVDAEVFARCLE